MRSDQRQANNDIKTVDNDTNVSFPIPVIESTASLIESQFHTYKPCDPLGLSEIENHIAGSTKISKPKDQNLSQIALEREAINR